MIRQYSREDFQAVIELYKNTHSFGGKYDPSRDTEEKLLATAEAGDLVVCEMDDAVIGTVMLVDNPHTCWLLRFCVDPESEYAEQAARELDSVARQVALERGHEDVIVYTNPSDDQLLERYRNLSYHEASDYRVFWKETK